MGEAATLRRNVRELFVFGGAEQKVRKWLEGFDFVDIKSPGTDLIPPSEMYFILACVDFTDARQVQSMVRLFSEHASAQSRKLVLALAPDELSQEILLLLQELGTNHVAYGLRRHDKLREHLERVCSERDQVGSLADYERQFEQSYSQLDMEGIREIIARLQKLPLTEDVLKLTAHASMFVGEQRAAETALKSILQLNPQNLWAANTLGKLYLRSGRAALGIETLRKLSSFHELNSDRFLTLGNAATLAGQPDIAEDALRKGHALSAGEDPRFQEGLAKLKLSHHDLKGALQILAGRRFSEDVISFLNMRAIMAIRSGQFHEGVRYYDHALAGCGSNKLIQARIKFNLGLAYARADELDKAYAALLESQNLGGPEFQRARGPLEIIAKLLKKGTGVTKHEMKLLAESVEWETLY